MDDPNLYRQTRRNVPDEPRYSYLSTALAVYQPAPYAVPPARYLGYPTEPFCTPAPEDRRYAGLHPTIDTLIATGSFAIPPADPVAALFSDRRYTTRLSLTDALSQIRQRYELYRLNMSDLEQAKLTACNSRRSGFDPPGWKPEDDPELVQSLEALSQMQRQERIGLWQDISRLRTSLPETIQQYLGASRKMDLLNDTWGDGK
jgi:hypothetical protein